MWNTMVIDKVLYTALNDSAGKSIVGKESNSINEMGVSSH